MNAARHIHYRFWIKLSQEQFLRYYQGSAGAVQVHSECGKRLSFPARHLRPFMTHFGIHGRFQLTVSAEHRFIELKKLS